MPCYHPMLAYRPAADHRSVNHKKLIIIGGLEKSKKLKFNPKGAYVDLPVFIPCGKCIGCKLEKARNWALRCVHEASLYEKNCFVTLTYSDENLPENKSVDKRTLQLFFKSLRRLCKNCWKHENKCECEEGKYEAVSFRYYACGEYGSKLQRPHYHVLFFDFDFPDKEVLFGGKYKSKNGRYQESRDHKLYQSKILETVWQNGFCTIGDVTFESAGYVARYVSKKITGDKKFRKDGIEYESAKDYYSGVKPEFALMSRRPGIAAKWFEKYQSDVYPKDFVTLRGKKHRPPRYYDYVLEGIDPRLFKEIKMKRLIEAEKNAESLERLYEREEYKLKQTKCLRRGYEE